MASLKGRRWRSTRQATVATEPTGPATIEMSALPAYDPQVWTGEKFAGGLNQLETIWTTDYWTLRQMSQRLFETNLYARGLIRRLITNEINTGLHLEATPISKLLGFAEDDETLAEWAEDVETKFELWGTDPWLCDVMELRNYGAMQQSVRRMALVDGDVLCVLRQSKVTGLPRVHVISGSQVQSPLRDPKNGNKICQGVELDSVGRHVAYWVLQEDGSSLRLPAVGEKSGRRLAWLVYGTDRRHEDVRGKPLLALVLQALKEVDRYRDATLRKAVLNSILAMFVEKTVERAGSQPFSSNGPMKKTVATTVDSTGQKRSYLASQMAPGMIIDELQVGERIVPHAQAAATEGFGEFEEAVIQTVAWANEIPPEILRLSFSSNYSASKAANNEFEMYVGKIRESFGAEFCSVVYVEWLVAAVFAKLIDAPRLIEAWRDSKKFLEFGAWSSSDWAGQIKPSIDLSKIVTAYQGLLKEGVITRDRMAREITGMKFSRVVKTLARENVMVADANRVLVELEQPPTAPAVEDPDLTDNAPPKQTRRQRAQARRNRTPASQLVGGVPTGRKPDGWMSS
jgi:lambda family phage portal protein